MLYEATIQIVVDVDTHTDAMDCISEALRPMLKTYNSQSSVLDWKYIAIPVTPPMYPQDYEYVQTSNLGPL